MRTTVAPIEQVLALRHRRHESRTEQTSCLIVVGVLVICYAIAVAARPSGRPEMFKAYTLLTTMGSISMLGLFLLVRRGWSSPVIKYLNASVQVTLVSAVCYIDEVLVGPVFAHAALGSFVYPLVIGLTALRLSPGLSIFAGLLSAVQYLALYAIVFRAGSGAAQLDATGSLGWSVTGMKTIVLISVGLAAALASRQFGRNTRMQVADALRAQSLQRTFGRYVSPAVAEAAVMDERLLQTRRTHAVILFGDIRGFTPFCESHAPELVTGLLNAYFEVACRVVEQEGGMVNKFIGDGFLAVFDPRVTPVTPVTAEVAAARAARRLMQELPVVLEPQQLKLGLALGSGEVVVGEIGSQDRCEFSVIGDAVNRTARLEGLNATLGSTCLLTAEINAVLPVEFLRVARGEHQLKGLALPIRVAELLATPLVAAGTRA